MNALFGVISSVLAAKAEGKVAGLLASKTQYVSTAGSSALLWSLLPRAIEGDPEAIGNVVIIALTWGGTLWARWRTGKAAPGKP